MKIVNIYFYLKLIQLKSELPLLYFVMANIQIYLRNCESLKYSEAVS